VPLRGLAKVRGYFVFAATVANLIAFVTKLLA
jgi:hypothetical protein